MGLKPFTIASSGDASSIPSNVASPQRQKFSSADDEALRARQLNETRETVDDLHKAHSSNPINSGTLFQNVAFFAGCTTKIKHLLGKPFTGYECVREQGAVFSAFEPTKTPYSAAINASTNASPIAVTCTAAHGFSSGAEVFISSHAVNTNANGRWVITVTGATTFTLNGSTGNGVGGATGTAVGIQLVPAIASSTNATPIVVTTIAAHNFSTGDAVSIIGHAVNTAANGTFTVAVLSATTFSLSGSVGVGVGAATGTATLQGYNTSKELWLRSSNTMLGDLLVF